MADVLHLLTRGNPPLAGTVIDRDVRAGDHVTVVVPAGTVGVDLPAGVAVRRLDGDLSYAQLLDLVFAADRVVTW